MKNIDNQYIQLLKDITIQGVVKGDRTGVGTKSIFGRMLEHDMNLGFPLLTTKDVHWESVVSELLWFMRGHTNIVSLIRQKNYIWVGDAYKRYRRECEIEKGTLMNTYLKEQLHEELRLFTRKEFIQELLKNDGFGERWGELGPIYGYQWRNFSDNGTGGADQLADAIHTLKTNPDSRRILVSAWNAIDVPHSVLPPCHFAFQFWTRELTHQERCNRWGSHDDPDRSIPYGEWLTQQGVPTRELSLMWHQRSVDTFLGLPFNIASYGLLLEIIAKECNMVVGALKCTLGDTHLYLNHAVQTFKQFNREPKTLPTIQIENIDFGNGLDALLEQAIPSCFHFNDTYKPHPKIAAPLNN